MRVFPNPYHVLDHKGRLAGACPEPEAVRPGGTMPLRRHVGAVRVMVDGSYKKADPSALIPAQADVFWKFTSEPVEVFAEGAVEHSFLRAFRGEELFSCEDGVPIQKLAASRMKAIREHVAAYGKAPDTSMWIDQFALDADVVAACEAILAEEEKAAAKAPAAAPATSPEQLKKDAEAEAAKRKAAVDRSVALSQRLVPMSKPKAAPKSAEPSKEK